MIYKEYNLLSYLRRPVDGKQIIKHEKQINGINFASDSVLVSVAADNKIIFWNINKSASKNIKSNKKIVNENIRRKHE